MKTMKSVSTSLENHQEKLIQKTNELVATLRSANKWAGEIGDQLVYLKYYATSSFQTEKEVMLRHGFSAYHAHREQHDTITEELRHLLEQVVGDNASVSKISDASNRLLNKIRQHVTQHDSELVAFMGKDTRKPEQVHFPEVSRKEYASFMDLHCYTA